MYLKVTFALDRDNLVRLVAAVETEAELVHVDRHSHARDAAAQAAVTAVEIESAEICKFNTVVVIIFELHVPNCFLEGRGGRLEEVVEDVGRAPEVSAGHETPRRGRLLGGG